MVFRTNSRLKEEFFIDRSAFYLNRRPVWGPHIYSLASYGKLRDQISADLEAVKVKGGMLVVPFDDAVERSLLIFLSILSGSLLLKGQRSHFYQYLDEPFLEPPNDQWGIWIIHQAPRFKNFPMAMESWLKPGRVILATGTPEMWEQYPLKVPCERITAFVDKGLSFEKEEKEFFDQAEEEVKTNKLMQEAYHLTALCDGWGVPLPFDLLARIIDKEGGGDNLAPITEEAYEKGVLFWIEREKPPALLVSTRSEGYGRQYLKKMAKKGKLSLEDYQPILSTIDLSEPEERFMALKLLQSWLASSRLRMDLSKEKFGIKKIREWIENNEKLIEKIALVGSASEILIWGQCLHQMGLYDHAESLFKKGLKNFPEHPYLLQAKAHLLSKWGQIQKEKQNDAFQAFSVAVKIVKNNPYLWQSWGVFEAERGNRRDAEKFFTEALNIDPQSICTLTSRADMYLESGLFEKAEKDMEKAKQIDPENIYVKHIRGRWHFFLGGTGEWEEAIKEWNEILDKDKRNLYSLQSLGHLYRERGEGIKAKENLGKAFSIDPENVPTLLELCQFQRDQGNYKGAKEWIDQALEVEPNNMKCLVALAGVERSLGQVDQAIARLEDLIQKWPDNLYARHLLSHCYYFNQGQKEPALSQLQTIINLTQSKNFPSFITYLTWAEISYQENQQEEAKKLLIKAENIYQSMSSKWPAHQKINALLEMARLFHLMTKNDKMNNCLDEVLKIDDGNKKILNFQQRMKT